MGYKTDFNSEKINKSKLKIYVGMEEKIKKQMLRDSNKYIPVDTGNLRRSGVITKWGLEWHTPYAAKQYYTIENKTSVNNPGATWRWFETAKAKYGMTWARVALSYGLKTRRY